MTRLREHSIAALGYPCQSCGTPPPLTGAEWSGTRPCDDCERDQAQRSYVRGRHARDAESYDPESYDPSMTSMEDVPGAANLAN